MVIGVSRQGSRIAQELTRVVETAVAKITSNLGGYLRKDTPKDTGYARSGWVASTGSADETVHHIRGRPSPAMVSRAEAVQQRALASTVIGYKLIKGSTYTTNTVPYIHRLNDGSSKQQPAGFVQRAMEKAVRLDPGDLT